ncbi:MAG: hypothetical protein QM774_11960 [Gordonia sp. (in: high G+C Gram-positive bacteria)]|uniref:hypothetical protein n=1 Tax=Gordonia sp. (in: high G+C Gram-positive bacteria) TaxID=84139 RepID=UPI0039E280DF
MSTILRGTMMVAAGAGVLLLSACGSGGDSAGPTSVTFSQEPRATATTEPTSAVANSPCKDDEGAQGHYMYTPDKNDWECDSTDKPDDVPPIIHTDPPSKQVTDPSGYPCSDESGADGRLVWIDPDGPWVCMLGS